MEPAPGRQVDRVRRLALEDLRLGPVPRIALRNDGQQGLRVRVLRVADDLACRPFFDDATEVHHGDPVGEVRRRREVVRDHEHAHVAVASQAIEQREDAGPDRDVEHRHGFVGQQQLRVQDQARRDRDALPLAARQLVRITIDEQVRGRQVDPIERLEDEAFALLLRPADAVDHHRLLDRPPDPEPGVQRLVRVLVDHLHDPPHRPEVGGSQVRDVAALDLDDARLGLDHPQDRLGGRRLAAAGLADDREHLARPHRERYAVHRRDEPAGLAPERRQQPAADRIPNHQVADLEQLRVDDGRAHPATTVASLR